MSDIPIRDCFVERDGSVFLVTNWQDRRRPGDAAVLIRLSPRHQAIYRTLSAKHRSHKSVWYALFVRGGRRDAKATRVPIDLGQMSSAELARLANGKLTWPAPSLAKLPAADLRSLVRSLYALSPAATGTARPRGP
ncbi:MAG: hypothetical protein H0W72_05460 [Planctomycetes bacterium]|nr:hypothetical protein [Planctomycetota bacterium]